MSSAMRLSCWALLHALDSIVVVAGGRREPLTYVASFTQDEAANEELFLFVTLLRSRELHETKAVDDVTMHRCRSPNKAFYILNSPAYRRNCLVTCRARRIQEVPRVDLVGGRRCRRRV